MNMTHPGLPDEWGIAVCFVILLLTIWALRVSPVYQTGRYSISLTNVPLISPIIKLLTASPWPLFILKLTMVSLFLLVIAAGLLGSPIPERNIDSVNLEYMVGCSHYRCFLSRLCMVCCLSLGCPGDLVGAPTLMASCSP